MHARRPFTSTAALGVLAAAGLAGPASATLEGLYALANWTTSGIAEGTTTIGSADADALIYSYDVDLTDEGIGVTFRTAMLTLPTEEDGVVTFDWQWSGFHAFAESNGLLAFIAEGPDGATVVTAFPFGDIPSSFDLDGSVEIPVQAGGSLRVEVGGSNFDSNSRLRGDLRLGDWTYEAAGFTGDAAVDTWDLEPMPDGAATVDPPAGDAQAVTWTYEADAGGSSGVTFRSSELRRTATFSGPASLAFEWSGSHAFFEAFGGLELFAETEDGELVVPLVPYQEVFGSFDFAGVGSIDVEAGRDWGVRVSGENFDQIPILSGTIVLSDLIRERPRFAGVAAQNRWSDAGIEEGLTELAPDGLAPVRSPRFEYDVDLGIFSGGVSPRTTDFCFGPVRDSGTVRFDWTWTGFHGFLGASATFEVVFIEDGVEVFTETVVEEGVSGLFTRSGSYAQTAFAGEIVCLRIGGGNADPVAAINGALELVDFSGPAVSCPADFDGSGTVDFDDLLSVLSSFGACPVGPGCPGDATLDGAVDFDDLLTVLSAFGDCP